MNNIEKNEIIYLIIPTINGAIDADPYITLSLDYIFEEAVIYEINLNTLEIEEVE